VALEKERGGIRKKEKEREALFLFSPPPRLLTFVAVETWREKERESFSPFLFVFIGFDYLQPRDRISPFPSAENKKTVRRALVCQQQL